MLPFLTVLEEVISGSFLMQEPPTGVIWRLRLCVTVPPGMELGEMLSSFAPGSAGVVYRSKLLLFVSSLPCSVQCK